MKSVVATTGRKCSNISELFALAGGSTPRSPKDHYSELMKAGRATHDIPELHLMEKIPLGVALYDADGVFMHANTRHAALVSGQQLPSRTDCGVRRWQAVDPDGHDLPPRDYPCNRAFHGRTTCPGIDMLHFGADGSSRWLTVAASPIRDPGRDAIIGIVVLVQDAFERTEMSAALTRTAQRFAQFAETSRSAIWIADAGTGELYYRNPSHLRLLGDFIHGIGCDGLLERVVEQDRALVGDRYDEVRKGSTEHLEYGARTDCRCMRLHETCFPVPDDDGNVVMIGGIIEDITPKDVGPLYLVGHDCPAIRVLSDMAARSGQRVKHFPTVADLLDVSRFLAAGCVVIDITASDDADQHLPRALADHAPGLPVVILGRPDTHVATAIAAMRAGAADYLISPCDQADILNAVERASARIVRPASDASVDDRQSRFDRLSKREREVMEGLIAGGTNKSIGRDLGISPRTVELHRSHLMERLNVRNLAELLQIPGMVN